MKPLKLYLTPSDAARFKVIITDTPQGGEGETESSLLSGGYDWRITVLKALEVSNFQSKDFQRKGEQDWMVQFGLLAEERTAFHPDMHANIGRLLYQTLFPYSPERSKVEQLLQGAIRFAESSSAQLHVQIIIQADVAQRARLSDYPWELLHDDRGFLAQRQVGFSRYIAYEAARPNLPSVDKVNVLLVSSAAYDRERGLDPLLSQERQAVHTGLDKAQREGHIRLIELKPATRAALRAYLTEHRGDDAPRVIHFDGHGFFGKRCKQCRTMHSGITADRCSCGASLGGPQGYLVFEDGASGADYVSAEELRSLLHQASFSDDTGQQRGVALIVLSACQSGLSLGGDSVFNGIAQSLIDHQVPAVVAMQFSVRVDSASAFAEQFYRCLGQRDSLVGAVSSGREAMGSEGNQWYRPVLYLRWQDNEGGQLFAPSQMDVDRIRLKGHLPAEHATEHYVELLEQKRVKGHAQYPLQSIPPSWAGMQDVRLSPLYVFWVDTAQEQVDYRQPFDLGMIWGLNRGSFVGIIATCALDTTKLCSYLETVERIIHKVVPEHERTFNTRWWIPVQAERFSNGPEASQEVWHAAIEPGNECIAYLREHDLPDGATPGIIIPVTESLLADKESRGICRDWCLSLLQRVFRNKELALIFHINGPVTPTVLRGICCLGEELKRQPEAVQDGIAVEIMVTERFARGEEPSSADGVAPGSAFCTWMTHITRSQAYQNRKQDLSDYQAVLNLYDRLQRLSGTPTQENYRAQQVVADIDIQALTTADAADTLDRQFLSLVKTYLPERAYALVDSYARSSRKQARRTALYVAADSDTLLDAWIECNIDGWQKGNTSDFFSFLSEDDLQTNQASPQSIKDAFVLALMRHYGSVRPSLREHIEECIGTLADADWLNPDMKAVWKLCRELVLGNVKRGEDPYTIFFQDGCDIERINLIMRARLHHNDLMPIAAFQRFLHLDRPDPWQLLLAMPPTGERIREIWRSLGPRQRAVLGFCSLEEWKGLYKDEGLYDKLLDCRHSRGKRALCYRLARTE